MLRFLLLIIILILPGYLLNIVFFPKIKFSSGEKFLFFVLNSYILIIFNILFLTGRYALPFICELMNMNFKLNIYNFITLLSIEIFTLFFLIWRKDKAIIFKKNIKLNLSYFYNIYNCEKKSGIKLLLILVGSLMIVVPSSYFILMNKMPTSPLVWGYHGITKTVLEKGKIPDTAYIYGEEVNFCSTYIGYNLLSSGLYLTLDYDDISFLMSMTVLTITLTFLYMLYFFTHFISFPYSLAITMVTMAMKLFIYKLSTFKTESLSICFLFMSCWIALKALKNDDNKLLIIAGITIASQVTINASISLVGGCIVLSSILINFMFDGKKTYQFKKFLFLYSVAFIMIIFIFFFSAGKIPVIGSLLNRQKIEAEDSTWVFIRVLRPSNTSESELSFTRYMPNYVYNDFTINYIYIFILISLSLVTFLKVASSRKLMMYVFLFTIFILCISLFFYYSYDTYIPKRSGFQRIFPYLYVSISFTPFIILKHLPNISIKFKSRIGQKSNRIIKLYYKPIIAISLFLIIFFGNFSFLKMHHKVILSEEGYRAMMWLRETTDPDSTIILTNEWTNGVIGGISRRKVLNDGDAPYLRQESIQNIITIINESRRFFQNPGDNLQLLKQYNVTHILISNKRDLRGIKLTDANEELLLNIGLVKVLDFKNIKVYEVNWTNINLET